VAEQGEGVFHGPAGGIDGYSAGFGPQRFNCLLFAEAGEIHQFIGQTFEGLGTGFTAAMGEGQHEFEPLAIQMAQEWFEETAHGMVANIT
jgi:hypothetical protein